MRIIRKSQFKSVPWKNGRGTTREVIRIPPTGREFQWRLSVAQIDAPGPFSDFSGYYRNMVLLRGKGLRLGFTDGSETRLGVPGSMVQFDGARAPTCELFDGPCIDLNLIVSKSMQGVSARVSNLSGSLSCSEGILLAVSVIGRLSVAVGNGEPILLDAWDLAMLEGGDGAVLSPVLDGAVPPLVFSATLGDNSD